MAYANTKYPNLPNHYSFLSDYYKHLSIQEKINAAKMPEMYSNSLPTYDSRLNFYKSSSLQVPEFTPVPELCSKQALSYSKVHPKKKIRMAYDKEIADAHLCSSSTSNTKSYQSQPINNTIKNLNFPFHCAELYKKTNEKPNYVSVTSHPNPQTEIDVDRKAPVHPPDLIPIYPAPLYIPSPLTPNSPNSLNEHSLSPIGGIPYHMYSESKWTQDDALSEAEYCNDKPQDLRVSYNERLKDVARDILTASSIPQLNCSEIPKLVSPNRYIEKDEYSPTAAGKYGIFDFLDKRMSGEIPSRSTHNHSDVLPNSPKCDSNCSSNCFNSYPPSSSNSKNSQMPQSNYASKESKWTEKQRCSPSRDCERYGKPHSNSCSHSVDKVEDPEAYLHKPIAEWSYADVIFFLMEACKELRINPGDVKFKRSDNGSILLHMMPNDFEVLAPNHGQILYDYFINFQTQHYMSTDTRNIHAPYRYNNNYGDVNNGYPPSDQPHHSHHHSLSPESIYPHHVHQDQSSESSHHYNQFPSSPYNSPYATESPTNEYVPQGSQYREPNHEFSPTESRQRKSYELPSAAWKTFPPLHNYDEPLSDPDEFDDEPPAEPPKKRGPGRPPKPESERKRRPKKTGRLWEFIRNLLLDPKTCPSLLRWEDAHLGVFRIVQSDAIANKWGMRKNNEKMNYEKLSRAMRYYYKAKIFEPVIGKRLVYKFGSNAKGWRPLNPNNPNFQNY